MLERIKQISEGIHLRWTVVKREVQLDKGMMSVWCSKQESCQWDVLTWCTWPLVLSCTAFWIFSCEFSSYNICNFRFCLFVFLSFVLLLFFNLKLVLFFVQYFILLLLFLFASYKFSWFDYPNWLALFGIAYYYHTISAAYNM